MVCSHENNQHCSSTSLPFSLAAVQRWHEHWWPQILLQKPCECFAETSSIPSLFIMIRHFETKTDSSQEYDPFGKTFWENETGPNLDRRLCRAEAQWFTMIIIFQRHFRIEVSPWVKPKGGENIHVVVVCVSRSHDYHLKLWLFNSFSLWEQGWISQKHGVCPCFGKGLCHNVPTACSIFFCNVFSIDLLYLFHHVLTVFFSWFPKLLGTTTHVT